MAETAATKTCKLCGANLNGQKRTKNTAGEYYCLPCWQSASAVFGDDPAVEAATVPVAKASATPPRTQSGPPVVRVVRSELHPTAAQAAIQGVKESTADALFKGGSKFLVLMQVGILTTLTKKFFPEVNNGILAIVALTSAIAAIVEVDLLARAMNFRSRWLDAEDLKSTAGILTMIGFGLAYALAIFLAITGA